MQVLSLPNERAVLTKAEAAQFLRIRPRTLDDWMRRGRVPFYKLPSKAVRFRADQLLEFLGKFETGSSAK
jgi:excisionase family DNA binding protein